MSQEEYRHISMKLEGAALQMFNAAFEVSGFENATEYFRYLIKKDYLESVKP